MTKLRLIVAAPASQGRRNRLRSHKCWWVSTMGRSPLSGTLTFFSFFGDALTAIAALVKSPSPAATPRFRKPRRWIFHSRFMVACFQLGTSGSPGDAALGDALTPLRWHSRLASARATPIVHQTEGRDGPHRLFS